MGTVVHGPGSFLFYGLHIIQTDDFNISIDGDQKISALEAYCPSRNRRKEIGNKLNDIELGSFRSVNSSIGWLGIAASPFCAFYASYLQQKAPKPKVEDLILQINSVKLLKKLGSTIRYVNNEKNNNHGFSIIVFSDASRLIDHGQLAFICGLLIGDLKSGSVFHTISWSSHKSKRPVKSIGAAEILAAGAAIDEGKLVRKAFQKLLNVDVTLSIAVDSKDLFTTLSTCRNSADRSIRADVNVIRFEFETHNITKMIWIPGKVNPADCLTKRNSPLVDALQLILYSGKIQIDFSDQQFRNSDQFHG